MFPAFQAWRKPRGDATVSSMLKASALWTHFIRGHITSFGWDKHTIDFDSDIIQGMNTLQPEWTPGRKCTAVVIDNLLHPGWITVPCDTPHVRASFVCERSASVDTEVNKNLTEPSPLRIADMAQMICPYLWITEAHNCFRLIGKTSHAETTTTVCNLIDANVYLIPEAFETLDIRFKEENPGSLETMLDLLDAFPHLEIMNRDAFPYLNSLTLSVNETTCILIQYSDPSLQSMNFSTTNCSDRLPEAGFVVCQTDDVINDLACKGSTFQCDDGTCVLEHYYCDGIEDCLDGSDEINCRHVCELHGDIQNISITLDCFNRCHPSNCSCNHLYFQCSTGGCIPATRLCDGSSDCQNDEDESLCVFCTDVSSECKIGIFLSNNIVHVVTERRGMNVNTKRLNRRFGGIQIHQVTTSSSRQNESVPNGGTYNCIQGNETIPVSQFNDLVPDCPGGDDEQLYRNFLLNQHADHPVSQKPSTCTNILMTTCEPGFLAVCFPRHKYCVLEVDELDQVRHCRNGAHLLHCRHYTCPAMFKCPGTFCIPFYMLCDGRVHCPSGEDEVACDQPLSCPGLLKCRGADVCLHWYDLKDGIARCPGSGDAIDFPSMLCDTHCICLGNAAICENLTLDSILRLNPYVRKLVIRNSRMAPTVAFTPFKNFKFLLFLNLAHNKVEFLRPNLLAGLYFTKQINLSFCGIRAVMDNSFSSMANLAVLDLRENNITALTGISFAGLKHLRHLYLQNNNMEVIFDCFDRMLPNIISVDLSSNKLKTFPKNVFCGNQISLRYLNLSHNNLLSLDTIRVLENLQSLQLLDLSPHDVCCLFPKLRAVCYPFRTLHLPDLQCTDLVAASWHRSLLWTVAFFVLSVNSLMCCYSLHRIRIKPQVIYDLLRLLLHVNDALLSLYIIGICIADTNFRGLYVIYATHWKTSIPCHFLGVLYSLSQYAAVSVVSIMAYMEWRLIVKPLGNPQHWKPLLLLLSLILIPLMFDVAYRLLPVNVLHSNYCLNYTPHILSLQTLVSIAVPCLTVAASISSACACHTLALSKLGKCPFEDKRTKERFVKRFKRMAKRYITCDLTNLLLRPATLLVPAAANNTATVHLLCIVLGTIPSIINLYLFSGSILLRRQSNLRK